MKKGSIENLRQKILVGAVELFREKGIEKVTTRELTEYLNISRSHIYHYFTDWKSLSLEAIDLFLQKDIDTVAAKIAGKRPDEALDIIIKSFLPDIHDANWRIFHSIGTLSIHDDAYAQVASDIMKKWASLIENVLNNAVGKGIYKTNDISRATRLICAAINGYADVLSSNPTSEDCERACKDLKYLIKKILSSD